MTFVEILVAGLIQGFTYVLISLGLTLMFGVLKIVNFAHGDFLMVAMYVTFFLFTFGHLDPVVALLLVVPLFVGLGAILYRSLLQRTRTAPDAHLAQIFVTVGLSLILQNLALLLFGKDYLSVRVPWAASVLVLGAIRIEWGRVAIAIAAIVLAFALQYFLHATRLGKQMRAVSQNAAAATLMGIDVQRVFTWTFALACGAVAVAGTLLATGYVIVPTIGLQFVLLAFMTVVIGGMGSITGAVFGGLIVGLVEGVTSFYLGAILSQVFIYAVFLGVLLYRPAGLFGIEGYEEVQAEG